MVEEKRKFSAIVHGRVQGVGFRYFVERRATSLGLCGWVKNLHDGSVAVLAEGNKKDLDILLANLQKGPAFSFVQKVDVNWEEFSGSLSSFDVTF
jgi:acylphosphatase